MVENVSDAHQRKFQERKATATAKRCLVRTSRKCLERSETILYLKKKRGQKRRFDNEFLDVPDGKGEFEAQKDVSPGELKDEEDDPDRECT